MNTRAPLVVGLIGGIGAGKSAVASEFVRRGAKVIAADLFGHEALRDRDVMGQVRDRWGDRVFNPAGEIDRATVAPIVFGDDAERRFLEALSFPYIRRRIAEEIARLREEGAPLIVLDAAVLLEAGWNDACDKLVYVDAPEEVRQTRVTGKRGWSAKAWAEREQAQLPLTRKQARADHVVDNSSTIDHLSRQVDDLMRQWGLAPAGTPASPPQP